MRAHRGSAHARQPCVRILGTRGVPARHGGFETAAENIAVHLRDHGWRVVVYCQEEGSAPIHVESWNGIERAVVPVATSGPLGTVQFDLRSILHACTRRDLCLTFGYNTAAFNVLQRALRIPNVINMDGLEWSRARWGRFSRAYLRLNEQIACRVGNHLVADHPRIQRHLAKSAPRDKISMIAYGAHSGLAADVTPVIERGLQPDKYLTLICRPVPENSILELVRGFSSERRGVDLVVLGDYSPEDDDYHRAVLAAAGPEVKFIGSVYDPAEVASLRRHSMAYLHGHTVGGTNPSLVEALSAGNPVVAHDNPYNRWVAQDAALYFDTEKSASACITELLGSTALRARLSAAAVTRHAAEFTWPNIAAQYQSVLERFVPAAAHALVTPPDAAAPANRASRATTFPRQRTRPIEEAVSGCLEADARIDQ